MKDVLTEELAAIRRFRKRRFKQLVRELLEKEDRAYTERKAREAEAAGATPDSPPVVDARTPSRR